MGLIVKSKTAGDVVLTTVSNDLTIKTQSINDLIIITKEIPTEGDSFLLLEDGFYLLLEDGFKLILE